VLALGHTTELAVFLGFFAAVTVLGFVASQWRAGKHTSVADWGLGGRQFGTLVTWFLIGGDFYTAYTIIAVPALVYGVGAAGFFALPYTTLVYPFVFLAMPRFWSVCQRHGLVTSADFVRIRYGSHWLATAVAVTGIVAVMPYIALQLVGMQVVLVQMGIAGSSTLMRDLPVTIAFLILAIYTYSAGLRAPALIAFVKDIMIYIVVIAAILVLPLRYGGYAHIFRAAGVHYATQHGAASLILPPAGFSAYATLALGSALAAFMYPHTATSILASASGRVIRRNAVLLPVYTFLLGLIALLGIIAAAAGLQVTDKNQVVPALLAQTFPRWFVGFCFAGIAIAALVPAAIMSIAAANLFTRNIFLEYMQPAASEAKQAQVARLCSLFVKFGALSFVLFLPAQEAIDMQLLGSVWILQTFPAIALGLWGRWFHDRALLAGWAAGMTFGTYLSYLQRMKSSVFPVHLPGFSGEIYIGVLALGLNLAVSFLLTISLDLLRVRRRSDQTVSADYLALDKDVV